MKTILFLIIINFSISNVYSQVTVDDINELPPGTKQKYKSFDYTKFNYLEIGENIKWNISGLILDSESSSEIISIDNSEYKNIFTNSNIVIKDSVLVSFFNNSKKDINFNGIVARLNNSDLVIQYKDPILQLNKTMSYGDVIEDTHTIEYQFPLETGDVNITGSGVSKTSVVAYGTLTTPLGKFENSILIKYEQETRDSMTSVSLENSHLLINNYFWYNNDQRSNLLNITLMEWSFTFADSVIIRDANYLVEERLPNSVGDSQFRNFTINESADFIEINSDRINILSKINFVDLDGKSVKLNVKVLNNKIIIYRSEFVGHGLKVFRVKNNDKAVLLGKIVH